MENTVQPGEVQEVLAKIDILEYISQYCDFTKRYGEWWALSPLKTEHTPSFAVSTEKQRFYDFSSGLGGDLLSFVRYHDHCGFNEALEKLKQYANYQSGGLSQSLEASKIAKRYRQNADRLKESTAQILPQDYMDRFEFDREKLKVWADAGISYETMYHFGVRYDRFSNRIVFPIKNTDGKIINVSGRTLVPNYKELGLRKYTYFNSLGTLDTLYGFSDNKESILSKKEIILFEGAKSVMLAHEYGFSNCCAILTSHLNQNQFLFLVRLGVRVVFALDEDVDIRQDKNIAKLKRYVSVEWVKNTDGLLESKMSPVDKGFETWQILYERRKSV